MSQQAAPLTDSTCLQQYTLDRGSERQYMRATIKPLSASFVKCSREAQARRLSIYMVHL